MAVDRLLDRLATANVLLALAVLYVGLIAIVSHLPGDDLAWIVVWDKSIHFLEYLPLGWLIAGWLIRRSALPSRMRVIGVGVSSMVILGIVDEFHQSFILGRCASGFDVVADTLGGGSGVLLAVWMFRAYFPKGIKAVRSTGG